MISHQRCNLQSEPFRRKTLVHVAEVSSRQYANWCTTYLMKMLKLRQKRTMQSMMRKPFE